MPTWGGLLNELSKTSPAKFDDVRRKYLVKLHQKTGRNIILYATKCTQPGLAHPEYLSITEEDIQGFMEVIHGLSGTELDLIIHSPGGSAESTEALVSYLRSKFNNIRVIVPQYAMSAATMLACAGNKIVLGKHSFLSPIDPQMIIHTPYGIQAIPAQAILDQFGLAKDECQDPKKLGTWLPILGQYGPALLVQCRNALDLSKELASRWLESYMFAGREDAKALATKISNELTNHQYFKSHGRHINREQAKRMGFIIEDLEADQEFQDLVLSVFHATTHTFDGTPAVKIIENHNGKAFIKLLTVGPPPMPPVRLPPIVEAHKKETKNPLHRLLDKIRKLFS